MYAQGVGSKSAIRRGDDVAGENKTERFLGNQGGSHYRSH
jgi:hypothetical protein